MSYETFDDIPFSVEADSRSGVYPDWEINPIEVQEVVPFSSILVTELIGYQPARTTWRIMFDRTEHYYAFLAKLRVVGTLSVMAGFQSLKGTQETRNNPPQVYEVLDQVRVARIFAQALPVDGRPECSVTFERMVDPVTRLAVVP